jgi:hypothetical protein
LQQKERRRFSRRYCRAFAGSAAAAPHQKYLSNDQALFIWRPSGYNETNKSGPLRQTANKGEIMRHPILSILILSCCIIPFACSVADAQPNNPCGHSWNRPLKQVTGRILYSYPSTIPGTNMEGLHLLVETPSGEQVVIHVFPTICINKNPPGKFTFTIGETVKVAGSEFITPQGGGQRNICAAELVDQQRNFTGRYALRDANTGAVRGCIDCPMMCKNQCSGKPKMCYIMCTETCGSKVGVY